MGPAGGGERRLTRNLDEQKAYCGGVIMASPADVEKGMKMAEQEMEYRVDLFNK